MLRQRFRLVLFTLAGLGSLALAQGPFFVNPYVAGGIAFQRGRLSVGVGFVRPVFNPYGPLVGGVLVQRVQHVAIVPPPIVPPPIVIIQPPPVLELPPERFVPLPRHRERRAEPELPPLPDIPRVPEIPPLPDVPAVPEIPPVPNIPPVPSEVAPPLPPQERELVLPPAPAAQDDDDGLRLPRREAARDDPREEAERLLLRGREEFAAGEYGRAALRFRRARELVPTDRETPFLLAQAYLSMEKYADVYEVLRAALAQRPDWPTTAFQPLELYATAGEYTQMIRALDATRARHPDEPLLQFLAGYVRWLDGRRHEATELFRQAQRGLADPEAIELFLKALPDTEPI